MNDSTDVVPPRANSPQAQRGEASALSASASLIATAPAPSLAAPVIRRAPAMQMLLEPESDGLGRRNRLSTFTFYVLAAAGGSAASVVAGLLAAWALLSIILGRFRLRLTASDWLVVATSLAFFAVMAISNVYHTDSIKGLKRIGSLLPFVMPLVLIARMRLSHYRDTLPVAFFGMSVGGCLLLVIVLAEYFFVSTRVQGFAGNQGPLSVAALLCAGWSLLHLSRTSSRLHLALACVGTLGGSVAVVLSGMRGTWPLLPICIAIALFTQRREIAALWRAWSPAVRWCLTLLLVAALAGVAVLAAPMIGERMGQMMSDLALIAADVDTPTSLNLRKEMYSAAVQAISLQPWFGYGAQNHWTAVAPYLDEATFSGMTFTHFHNVFLTVGVDAGLIGIAGLFAVILAPIVVAWRSRHALGGSRRLGATLILVVAFVGAGMTNIMFFHDILDAVWVFSVSLLAASVPAAAALDAGSYRTEG